jgi:methanethiol oxidase
MASWTPDSSFYPSPRMAMRAAPETLAYVAAPVPLPPLGLLRGAGARLGRIVENLAQSSVRPFGSAPA